jgi:hypothetical protein
VTFFLPFYSHFDQICHSFAYKWSKSCPSVYKSEPQDITSIIPLISCHLETLCWIMGTVPCVRDSKITTKGHKSHNDIKGQKSRGFGNYSGKPSTYLYLVRRLKVFLGGECSYLVHSVPDGLPEDTVDSLCSPRDAHQDASCNLNHTNLLANW